MKTIKEMIEASQTFQEVITESVKYYGVDKQSTVCMEECAELIQAISKVKRYGLKENSVFKNNLIEEIADVLICLEYLQSMYSITDEEIDGWLKYKIKRLDIRMRNSKLSKEEKIDWKSSCENLELALDDITQSYNKIARENVDLEKLAENSNICWHSSDEIPTNEKGKDCTVNVLNNHHQTVYYSFAEGCWIDDTSCCDADEFEAWCYFPEYKEKSE